VTFVRPFQRLSRVPLNRHSLVQLWTPRIRLVQETVGRVSLGASVMTSVRTWATAVMMSVTSVAFVRPMQLLSPLALALSPVVPMPLLVRLALRLHLHLSLQPVVRLKPFLVSKLETLH
jgi:hypothetical protein